MRGDHDVMRTGAPSGGPMLVAATDLEAAGPFVSTTLAAAGQLSLGVVDLVRPRPSAATRWPRSRPPSRGPAR